MASQQTSHRRVVFWLYDEGGLQILPLFARLQPV